MCLHLGCPFFVFSYKANTCWQRKKQQATGLLFLKYFVYLNKDAVQNNKRMILHQVLWFEYWPIFDSGERSSSALKATNAQKAFAKVSVTSYFFTWLLIFFYMPPLCFGCFLKLLININAMVSVNEQVTWVKPEFCLVVKLYPKVELKVSEV